MVKKTTSKKTKKIRLFYWWQLKLLLILSAVFLVYLAWLDLHVRTEFTGKKWEIPARVYASPLDLYPGLEINADKVVSNLKRVGYQHFQSVYAPGQYAASENTLHIYSRDFQFSDSKDTAQHYVLEFSSNQLKRIYRKRDKAKQSIIRLEPELIGKIYPEHHEDRVLVKADEIPEPLIQALLAIEDRHFFEHFGIDPKGILRSIWVNLRTGKLSQGGSTLTQQLVKNYFLTSERTLQRKLKEVLMAFILEFHYSKQEILMAYVNEIYLGQQGAKSIHGFGSAAQYYFARPLNELSVEQHALLVGMVKGASFYNPFRHPERAKKRRDLVLSKMKELGYINEQQLIQSQKRALGLAAKPGWDRAKYPAFLDLVKRHLRRDYPADILRSEGLNIFTTLQPLLQSHAQTVVQKRLEEYEKNKKLPDNVLQSASVIIDIHSGDIISLVGGRSGNYGLFNRVLDSKRQIGSLVKPAVYLTALQQPEKFHVLSKLKDSAIKLKQANQEDWIPRNYDGEIHGDVPLFMALAKSYNLAAVNLGMQLGLNNVANTLQSLGTEQIDDVYPSMLLGAINLTPYEVVQMYQTIASGGFHVPLRSIRAVVSSEGEVLKRYDLQIERRIDAESMYLLQYALSEVVNQGTARRLSVTMPSLLPLAGKTGTTNGLKDSWFAGFGDNVLGVVWVGRDDNQSSKLTGSSGALPIWSDIMLELKPQALPLLNSDKIVWQQYDYLFENQCLQGKEFPFVAGYALVNNVLCNEVIPEQNAETNAINNENEVQKQKPSSSDKLNQLLKDVFGL